MRNTNHRHIQRKVLLLPGYYNVSLHRGIIPTSDDWGAAKVIHDLEMPALFFYLNRRKLEGGWSYSR